MADEFIEKFHGISGDLLRDRKKAFYQLLENYRTLEENEDVLSEINEKLQPKTYLEETYKLELLIHFKRSQDLLNILKSGNDIAASRIIKQNWFLTNILKDVPPKEFVRDILPQLSLIVRLKILKQILKQYKNEKFINALFDELIDIYGSRPALVIISGCSVDKIKKFLTDRSVKLPPAQLKLLHDKDRSLIQFYYELFHRRWGDMSLLDSFSKYLSKKDPSLFVEFRMKYKFNTYSRLGRQSTKIFVKENKNALIEDPLKYLDLQVLKNSALVRELGNDFSKFLMASFPESPSEFSTSPALELIENYPKKRRYNLLLSLFKEAYNKDLYSFKEIMTEKLLAQIPEYEEREKWVGIFDNDVSYIKYKRSTEAIPELKEHLFKADDVKFRKKLFGYLISSCSINKDYDSLLEILKLVCKRFRNTDGEVLYSILRKIREKMEMKLLSEQHWKYIHEIILVQNLRNLSMDECIIFEYCTFLHKSGKSFEEMIPLFLKCNCHLSRYEFIDQDENFQKMFLELLLKYYPELDQKNIEASKAIDIILAIKKWNKKHPNDSIICSNVQSMMITLQEEIKSSWMFWHGLKSVKYLICSENNTKDFEDLYFDNVNSSSDYTITKWFLKYKPEVFQKYVDKTHHCFIRDGKSLTGFLRKFEYSGLVKFIEDYYVKEFEQQEQSYRDQIMQLLISIIPSKNYLEYLEKYIPTTEKLNITEASGEEKTKLQIQMILAQSGRFSKCHIAALPILFQYCKGDCLQPALYSLYSCFNRIPEKELRPYISLLLDKPVSLRKHAIFLASLVFPVSVNYDLIVGMMEKEKDTSVRKHLFTSTFKYFLKNPSNEFFLILKKYMDSLTKNDIEDLNLITNIHKIPDNFKGKFAEAFWEVFEQFEEENTKGITLHIRNFCSNIQDHDVRFLPLNFCIKLINKKLFDEGHELNDFCSKFAIQFMMYSEDIGKAIKSVMNIFQKYKTDHWEKEVNAKSIIYQFCSKIFEKVMILDDLSKPINPKFPEILSEEWKLVFSQQETFEEHLMLEFMILKYERAANIQNFAKKTSELFLDATKQHGDLIVGVFQDFLSDSLRKLLGDKKYNSKLMEFLKYFVDCDEFSIVRRMLVIHLLPVVMNEKQVEENYNYVMEKIRLPSDPFISILLNNHFKRQ